MTQRPVLNKNRSVWFFRRNAIITFSLKMKRMLYRQGATLRVIQVIEIFSFDVEKKMQLLNFFISENTNFYDWVCNKNQVELCRWTAKTTPHLTVRLLRCTEWWLECYRNLRLVVVPALSNRRQLKCVMLFVVQDVARPWIGRTWPLENVCF